MSAPIPPRPEPVLDAASVAGNVSSVVGGLAGIFATLGVVTHWTWAEATAAALTAVGAGLAKYMPLVTARGARAQVTPVSDPQAMDGTPLVAAAPFAPSGERSPLMGPDAA